MDVVNPEFVAPPQPMPTQHGDVVMSHTDGARLAYLVWPVVAGGQQRPSRVARTIGIVGCDTATQMARHLARQSGGRIFLLELPSGTWGELSE